MNLPRHPGFVRVPPSGGASSPQAAAAGDPASLLSDGLFAKVRRLEIRTRKAWAEGLSGAYRSAVRGRGIEFSELREHLPEDDAAHLDWATTARLGKPFTKCFSEERELTVLLVLDVSASMEAGTRARSVHEIGVEVCALLALSAAANRDRVGLMTFTADCECYVPPGRGRTHALRAVRELVAGRRLQRGTDFETSLRTLMRLAPKRGTVFLVSDFVGGGDLAHPLGMAARNHELFVVHLPGGIACPPLPRGWVLVEDAETGAKAYRKFPFKGQSEAAPGGKQGDLPLLCRRVGARYVRLGDETDCAERLIRHLRDVGGRCSCGVRGRRRGT